MREGGARKVGIGREYGEWSLIVEGRGEWGREQVGGWVGGRERSEARQGARYIIPPNNSQGVQRKQEGRVGT